MTRRKTLLPDLVALGAAFALSVLACRGWPEMNRDVQEVRALHQTYRKHTAPRSATETADVEALADRLESIFDRMERLTK